MTAAPFPTTKERILEAAEDLMLAKSFHSVGLNEILAAVQVPKGSFYHYFESKEHFGVELLQHYVAETTVWKRRLLLSVDHEPNPLTRVIAFLELGVARMFERECKGSCLVAKLSAEVCTFSDPMRSVLAAGLREWHSIYGSVIIEGHQKGVFRSAIDPDLTASLIQDLWMGANQRCQVQQSVGPLRDALEVLRAHLTP